MRLPATSRYLALAFLRPAPQSLPSGSAGEWAAGYFFPNTWLLEINVKSLLNHFKIAACVPLLVVSFNLSAQQTNRGFAGPSSDKIVTSTPNHPFTPPSPDKIEADSLRLKDAQHSNIDYKVFEDTKAKAVKGDATSQCKLGDFYYLGKDVAKNYVEAVKWYRKAAEQGNVEAQYDLGICYLHGDGVIKDVAEAANWWRKAGSQGDVKAQSLLGAVYASGDGVTKDVAEAVKWFRKAAEQGDTGAQLQLGFFNECGEGVPKDFAEAVKWYRKAADQGDAAAQWFLGRCYNQGTGVTKNATEAIKWFRKSADRGDTDAQHSLGTCYAGDGDTHDMTEAVKWNRKAAEHGNAAAQQTLGAWYSQGFGVIQDAAEAARWYRKAAEQGENFAQYYLGRCYERGKGVRKDSVLAHKWFNLSSAQGNEDARQNLLKIEDQMTAAQIAEAQRLARGFTPRKSSEFGKSDLPELEDDTRPTATGTGFFITEDGYLVTNEHVVKDATQVRLLTASGSITAKVVKVDSANDLALLRVEGKFISLPITSSRTIRLGNTVATVGFPNTDLQGFAPKLAKGEIAALSGAYDDVRFFQISVPVQPGNSGGALVDELGNVVGVVAAKLSASAALATSGSLPENVNYAIKSSFLLGFLESVPDVSSKLKIPYSSPRKFEDIVNSTARATVLVLVY